jgi:hypothetical protein
MKEMKSEIKEIRAICGGVVEDSKKLDDYIPIEIFYLDGPMKSIALHFR